MNHRPLNAEEGSALTPLRTVGLNQTEIARKRGRYRAAASPALSMRASATFFAASSR